VLDLAARLLGRDEHERAREILGAALAKNPESAGCKLVSEMPSRAGASRQSFDPTLRVRAQILDGLLSANSIIEVPGANSGANGSGSYCGCLPLAPKMSVRFQRLTCNAPHNRRDWALNGCRVKQSKWWANPTRSDAPAISFGFKRFTKVNYGPPGQGRSISHQRLNSSAQGK
jgi:hypothetical protein